MTAVTERVKQAAREQGFDLVGIARAEVLDPTPLDTWLARGFDASLSYVRNSRDERLDVTRVQPGAKSVVAVAVNYLHPEEPAPPEPHGVVARYARGRDYHNVLRRPLRRLRDAIADLIPGSTGYASCDARPVMEKQWAQRAGLGWIGKNGCLITPEHGSWVLLGCVITTAELEPDAAHPDRCGTCSACLPACPTKALHDGRVVDAGACIAFHTIEHRDAIPDPIGANLRGRLFGCDLCQDVCPWNRRPEPGGGKLWSAMQPAAGQTFVPLNVLRTATNEALTQRIAGTPLARAGVDKLRHTATWLDDTSGSDDP